MLVNLPFNVRWIWILARQPIRLSQEQHCLWFSITHYLLSDLHPGVIFLAARRRQWWQRRWRSLIIILKPPAQSKRRSKIRAKKSLQQRKVVVLRWFHHHRQQQCYLHTYMMWELNLAAVVAVVVEVVGCESSGMCVCACCDWHHSSLCWMKWLLAAQPNYYDLHLSYSTCLRCMELMCSAQHVH